MTARPHGVFNQQLMSFLGAILCDLPGTADANAARNSIAKNYMKNCDCIWILAPITRYDVIRSLEA